MTISYAGVVEPLTEADEALVHAAEHAAEHAYAPYSGYHVGAALRTADGTVFAAANVENASYGLSLCAEANAVAAAAIAGYRAIARIAVVGYPAARDRASLATPCGRCRQLLREFSAPDGTVVIVRDLVGGETLVASLERLLPFSFGPDALG